jgi:hypothetical protein
MPYYDESFRTELRILHKEGAEYRRQWIFRDAMNTARLTASGSGGLFGGASPEDERRTGFIELQNSGGAVIREFRFEDDRSEWEFLYVYGGDTLLKTETRFKQAPDEDAEEEPFFVLITSDEYRYTRTGSLRAIDRSVHDSAGLSRLSFPRLGPDVSSGWEPETPASYVPEFLQDMQESAGINISYTLDSRGRILTEVWKDEDGVTVGEFRNTWSGDRLKSVQWKSPNEDRLVEYEYDDDGNSILERNFNNGILERIVTNNNGRDIEERYMNGRVILRAVWEKGLKISEERIHPDQGINR